MLQYSNREIVYVYVDIRQMRYLLFLLLKKYTEFK